MVRLLRQQDHPRQITVSLHRIGGITQLDQQGVELFRRQPVDSAAGIRIIGDRHVGGKVLQGRARLLRRQGQRGEPRLGPGGSGKGGGIVFTLGLRLGDTGLAFRQRGLGVDLGGGILWGL